MKNKLVAYATDFTSFLIENGLEPRRIVLFGSAATGEFDEESDVDIFIDIDKHEEKKIKSILKIFDMTFGEAWRLKGVSNPISLQVGNLDRSPELKRSMQSYGILLYGKYNEFPENMKSYILFRLDFIRIPRSEKVNIWRNLYGYRQKIGRKTYTKRGIIEDLGGKKLEKSIVIIPMDKSQKLKQFLNKNKVGFSVNEIWSDDL